MSCVPVLPTHLIELFPLSPGKPRTGSPDRPNKTIANVCILLHKNLLLLRNAIAHGSATLGTDLLLAVFSRGTEVWEMSLG